MNLLSQILYSGVVAKEEGRGLSFTLILILIITALVVVILIRDKKIRDKVKGFFALIGRKIKNSRINSKIEKETNEISELLTKLGRKGFENKIFPNDSGEITDSIKEERGVGEKFDKVLANIEKKIEKLKSDHEIFISLKKSEIEKEEKLKNPVEKQYKEFSGKFEDLKKESGDNEKKIGKIVKGIDKTKAELKRLAEDALLDPEERESRKDREENALKEFNRELSERKTRETYIPKELSICEKDVGVFKSKLDIFKNKIEKLEKEYKESVNKYDDKVKEMVKEKGHYTAERSKTDTALAKLYGEFGKILDKERPENNDLAVIYIDMDRARERIKDLRSQLT